MAQHYWEADGADAGGAPSNMTYAQPWASWNTVQVASYAGHVDWDYGLELSLASYPDFSRRLVEVSAIEGNSIDDNATVELYIVFTVDSPHTQGGVAGRTNGGYGTEYSVYARAKIDSTVTDVGQHSNGSHSFLESNVAGVSYYIPIAMRLQMSSTNVKMRIWDYDNAEPGTWDSDTSTTSVTAAGGVGIFSFAVYGKLTVLALGVGTGGDAAPTSAPAGVTETIGSDVLAVLTEQSLSLNQSETVGAKSLPVLVEQSLVDSVVATEEIGVVSMQALVEQALVISAAYRVTVATAQLAQFIGQSTSLTGGLDIIINLWRGLDETLKKLMAYEEYEIDRDA